MLPLVSSALGILWHGQDRTIGNIGTYIKDVLKPIIVETSGSDERLMSWEEQVDVHERSWHSRFLPLAVPLFIFFAGFSIVGLTLGLFAILDAEARSPEIWTVWGLGIGMVLAYLRLWISFLRAPYRSPS